MGPGLSTPLPALIPHPHALHQQPWNHPREKLWGCAATPTAMWRQPSCHLQGIHKSHFTLIQGLCEAPSVAFVWRNWMCLEMVLLKEAWKELFKSPCLATWQNYLCWAQNKSTLSLAESHTLYENQETSLTWQKNMCFFIAASLTHFCPFLTPLPRLPSVRVVPSSGRWWFGG